MCHAVRHIFKKGNTHRSEQLQFYANSASTKTCLLVTFLLYQHTAPGRNHVSSCSAVIRVDLCKSSRHLLKELPALHESSLFTSFFCDWQRGASVSTMMQLSPPWEFNAMDAQPRTLFIIMTIIFLLCLGLEEAWKQM